MSCNDIASVLDTHRATRLAPAERARVDAHLSACADCSAAWYAHSELLALRVPPVPATLLERALLASRVPQHAPARRARISIVVGSAMLAGAAAAAVTIFSLTTSGTFAPITNPPAGEEQAPTRNAMPVEVVEDAATPTDAPSGDGVTSVELVETALSIAPIVRHPPDYPAEALKQRLGGHVQLKFDVTAAGIVENVSVVESSDPQFEDPAVRAVSQWRYLPRIVAGRRVAATDVRTNIRWEPPSD